MKMIVAVALALVAVAAAAPAEEPQLLRSELNQSPEGAYNYGFEVNNGIARSETGELKEVVGEDNKPHSVVVVRGTYSSPDDQGKPQTINYYADENGYHAEGDSIPKVAARR